MKTMRQRAQALGGTLRIESAPGEGTSVHVNVPLKEVD
jgi:signal transduction histidine kinase